MAILSTKRVGAVFVVVLALIGVGNYCARDGAPLSFHRLPPTIRIVHVVKRGLTLEGEEAIVGTEALFRTIKKQPFRSRMTAVVSVRVMPKSVYVRANEVGRSLAATAHIKPMPVLRSWNSEAWFVFLPIESEPLAFVADGDAKPPQEITDLFHSIEKLPVAKDRADTLTNRCWGLCSNPQILLQAPLHLP